MLTLLKRFLVEALIVLALARKFLWRMCVSPNGFGPLKQIGERLVMGQKIFTYSQGLLPVPAEADVVKQRLTVKFNGEVDRVHEVDRTADVFKFEAPEGVEVTLDLDYLDAAGNDSENVSTSFVVVDNLAPSAPAGFGELKQVAERVESDPEPPPAEEPPPAPPAEEPPAE